MVIDKFHNKDIPLISKALGAYALRQKVTARNMANATSPYFQPNRVKFEELFHPKDVSLKGTKVDSESSMPIGPLDEQDVIPEKTGRYIPQTEIMMSGETHVNIDKEMSEMAQNQVRFDFGAKMAKEYFREIASAIKSI